MEAENDKSLIGNNYTNIYLNRLIHYSGYGAILGGIASTILLLKFRRGFILGLGIGAGYCHDDLMNFYKTYYAKTTSKTE